MRACESSYGRPESPTAREFPRALAPVPRRSAAQFRRGLSPHLFALLVALALGLAPATALPPLRGALLALVFGSGDVDEAGVVVLGAAAAGVEAAHVWLHRGVLAKGCTPADSVRKRVGQWAINVLT